MYPYVELDPYMRLYLQDKSISVICHSGELIGRSNMVEFQLSARTHSEKWSTKRRTAMII